MWALLRSRSRGWASQDARVARSSSRPHPKPRPPSSRSPNPSETTVGSASTDDLSNSSGKDEPDGGSSLVVRGSRAGKDEPNSPPTRRQRRPNLAGDPAPGRGLVMVSAGGGWISLNSRSARYSALWLAASYFLARIASFEWSKIARDAASARSSSSASRSKPASFFSSAAISSSIRSSSVPPAHNWRSTFSRSGLSSGSRWREVPCQDRLGQGP